MKLGIYYIIIIMNDNLNQRLEVTEEEKNKLYSNLTEEEKKRNVKINLIR